MTHEGLRIIAGHHLMVTCDQQHTFRTPRNVSMVLISTLLPRRLRSDSLPAVNLVALDRNSSSATKIHKITRENCGIWCLVFSSL